MVGTAATVAVTRRCQGLPRGPPQSQRAYFLGEIVSVREAVPCGPAFGVVLGDS